MVLGACLKVEKKYYLLVTRFSLWNLVSVTVSSESIGQFGFWYRVLDLNQNSGRNVRAWLSRSLNHMIPSFPFKLTSNYLHTKIRKEKCFQFQHDSKFVRTLYPIRGGSTCGLRHWPYGWRILLNRQGRIGWRVSNLG